MLSLPISLVLAPRFALEIMAITFFCVYLIKAAVRLKRLTGSYLEHHAHSTDEPEAVIFLVTLAAAAVSLLSLFLALNRQDQGNGFGLPLAFASVALGWATIHTMAAMHYAHVYWVADESRDPVEPARGLMFPETDTPGGYDFLYFAFVIGMTAQTSDVAITTTTMRRINLAHAVVSFFFNTVLVAAAVNAAVQLAG